VEVGGGTRVLGTLDMLVDGECTLEQRFGFGIPPLVVI
jgi:hypothetical protein